MAQELISAVLKRAGPPKRKTTQKVTAFLDIENKRRRLQEQFESLLSSSSHTPMELDNVSNPNDALDAENHTDADDSEGQWVDEPQIPPCPPPTSKVPLGKKRRLVPSIANQNLYAKWRVLLPSLVEPLLGYISHSVGKPLQPIGEDLKANCQGGSRLCEIKMTTILCLYFDRKCYYPSA